jgi:hypothetical protein
MSRGRCRVPSSRSNADEGLPAASTDAIETRSESQSQGEQASLLFTDKRYTIDGK